MPYKDPAKQKEYARLWIAKRRADFFTDKSCSKCGSISKLELHHLDPNQKESNSIWSWSKTRRELEIKKCIVLCKECHKLETKRQLSVEWNHGTSYGYRTHGCRCVQCRTAQTIYMREYRARSTVDKLNG